MKHSNQNTRSFDDDEINRRNFIGAVGAVSISQIDSIKTLMSDLEAKSETHFIETALEFELLDDGITPARKVGPYRYHAVRNESALFGLARMDSKNFSDLVTADTVTFGLDAFKAGVATFENYELNVLPTTGSDTPRVTRFIRLNQWSDAPSYDVQSAENDDAIVEVAGKRVEIPRDVAERIELNERKIPANCVPGYHNSDGLTVSPRLEVRNYGRVQVYDAREYAWK